MYALKFCYCDKQMGSTMKPTIFNEKVATALRNWHRTAKKHIKKNKQSGLTTPMSSRPGTPSRGNSPLHLLRHYRSELDSVQTSPRRSNFNWETEGSPSPSHHYQSDGSSTIHHRNHEIELSYVEQEAAVLEPGSAQVVPLPQPSLAQHEINIGPPKDFSFDKRTGI